MEGDKIVMGVSPPGKTLDSHLECLVIIGQFT